MAQFGAVHACRGEPQRLQEAIELGNRPARDNGQSTVQSGVQRAQRANQFGLDLHQLGARREVSQRAVEIQKQRGIGFDER